MKRLVALAASSLWVLLATVAGLPSAAGSSPAFPPVRPTRVLVLGDSVMKGAEAAVVASLAGRDVVFDAEVNRSTATGADIVAQRGADWDVAVVFLGHNDGGSPGAFQPAARRILDQLRDVPYVSWLTIHEVRPYYPGVNQFIAGLQAEYPNLHVGDWNAVATAHPEGVAGDGLHLNATGANLMAGLVGEQVEAGEQRWNEALIRLAAAQATTTAPPTTTTALPATTTTSTSTTTTAEATTTTSEAATSTTSACVTGTDDGEAVADCPGAPHQAADDDRILLPALGAAAAIAVGFGVILVARRRRQRREDQFTADTAG